MNRMGLLFAALLALAVFTPAGSASAQATRTWVSGVGDDANPCSRTAPCKTFAGAISKTAVLGEINCLDPGGFGSVTITKSITIDCSEEFGSILSPGTNGININFNSFSDTRRTVRLRHLLINGADTGINGINILGTAQADSEVFIERVVVDGQFGASGVGIRDGRTGGGELYITDTIVRNTAAAGIVVSPGGTAINAVFDHVRIENALNGIVASTSVKLMVNDCVIAGNTTGGVVTLAATAEVNIDNCVISGNSIGISNGGGTIRLSNSDIAFNTTGLSGTVLSFGNNRISGNGSLGTAPTLIAPNNTNPSGQQ